MKNFTILCFFGTRPEAIKMAPVVERLRREKRFRTVVAVSAQHRHMLDQVLAAFRLKVDIDLDLMEAKQTLTNLTARVIQKFAPVLEKIRPDLVLVHGDTTTTFAGALACYYRGIPIAHVEAGLRTFDLTRPFPEEANRQLTDVLSTLHFCPTTEGLRHLKNENKRTQNIFVTGNTVIDALLTVARANRPVRNPRVRRLLGELKSGHHRIVLLTAHRRENFGKPFMRVLSALATLSRRFPDVHWIYPVHPNPHVVRPAKKHLKNLINVHLVPPLEYGDLVQVMKASTLVITDSGGLQEEAPSLGKPVLVLREVTERPEAVRAGTVRLVGTDTKKIMDAVTRLLTNRSYYRSMANAVNPYGDGKAAARIAHAVRWYFGLDKTRPAPFRGGR